MSAIIDLNGATHTISADSTETCFRVIDSSVGKNGILIISAGAHLKFDDAVGAGFATDWVGTLTINGVAENMASVESVDTFPHHPFAMALACSGIWTECRIAGNSAFTCSGTVIENTVRWGYDVYCSVDDVRRLTGIAADQLSDADISEFIKMATDEIDDYTGRKWLTGTMTNEDYDYNSEGFLHLSAYPVQSITTLSYRGGSLFTAKTQGADEDYYASPEDLKRGIVWLLNEPEEDYQAVRVTYVYGDATTSPRVRRLCALLAGHDSLLGTQVPQKVGALRERLGLFQSESQRLKKQLGAKLQPWDSRGKAEEYRYPRPRISKIGRLLS
jgi:uncharacterized small protein (DUF1192 family)